MAKGKTVAAVLVDALRELGVRYVFGVPSGGWVDYMEALRTSDGIEFILTTHEGAAGLGFNSTDAPGARRSSQPCHAPCSSRRTSRSMATGKVFWTMT